MSSEWLVEKLQERNDELAQQLAACEEECAAWKGTAETFEDFYRKTEKELDEAVELLHDADDYVNTRELSVRIAAYLAKHEGKEND